MRQACLPRRSRRGLSVVETVFALAVAGIVTAGAASAYRFVMAEVDADAQAQRASQAVRRVLNSFHGHVEALGMAGCPTRADAGHILTLEWPRDGDDPDAGASDINGDAMLAFTDCVDGPPLAGGRDSVIFRVLVVSDDGNRKTSHYRAAPGMRVQREAVAQLVKVGGKVRPVGRGMSATMHDMEKLSRDMGFDPEEFEGEIIAYGERMIPLWTSGTRPVAPALPRPAAISPGTLFRPCPESHRYGLHPACYGLEEETETETRTVPCGDGRTGRITETRTRRDRRAVYLDPDRDRRDLDPVTTDWTETANTCTAATTARICEEYIQGGEAGGECRRWSGGPEPDDRGPPGGRSEGDGESGRDGGPGEGPGEGGPH